MAQARDLARGSGRGSARAGGMRLGFLVVVGLDRFGLVIGIEDHPGENTNVAVVTPPSGSEHRMPAVRTSARWRLTFESGFEAWDRAIERRWQNHDKMALRRAIVCYVR